jgi:hypothetical protein
LQRNGLGNLPVDTFQYIPAGCTINLVVGNTMTCKPSAAQAIFDTYTQSYPDCQVRNRELVLSKRQHKRLFTDFLKMQ